jgi:hypothetical protein
MDEFLSEDEMLYRKSSQQMFAYTNLTTSLFRHSLIMRYGVLAVVGFLGHDAVYFGR